MNQFRHIVFISATKYMKPPLDCRYRGYIHQILVSTTYLTTRVMVEIPHINGSHLRFHDWGLIAFLSCHYCIAGTLEPGYRHQDHFSITFRSAVIANKLKTGANNSSHLGFSRQEGVIDDFWCHHWIADTLKPGYRHQNLVYMCLNNKVTVKTWFWQ